MPPPLCSIATSSTGFNHPPSPADWAKVEPLEYLAPFLEVIRSPETSGPITGVALTSVRRLLASYTRVRAPLASVAAWPLAFVSQQAKHPCSGYVLPLA